VPPWTPLLPSCILEPLWDQFAALLPTRQDTHPLGCHRPRIPDRAIFDKLIQVLVFGCSYRHIEDATCSATTLRRRRDQWIALGLAAHLHLLVLAAYDRMLGLELDDLAIDGCITKAPCGGEVAGRSPVDRGKQGLKRSVATEAKGIPLAAVPATANRHDSPLLGPTLDQTLATLDKLGPLPEEPTVHLDAGYDSDKTRTTLAERGLAGQIAHKGIPAPIQATKRWPVGRTHAWGNNFGKLRWCTERNTPVVEFWLALAQVIITMGRLIRQAWTCYRWRPAPGAGPKPAHRRSPKVNPLPQAAGSEPADGKRQPPFTGGVAGVGRDWRWDRRRRVRIVLRSNIVARCNPPHGRG
jgi:transposase